MTPDRAPSMSRGRAWFGLALLTAMMTLNQIDRRVASLVIEPLKAEFGLTDSQLGMLTGLAFGMVYAITAIPLGLLADRMSRRNLLAIVLALWSALTALAGLANSYAHLLLARVGVGAAEAGASPTAVSMITDMFPRERRATAVAIFQTGISLGSFLCFLVGAWIVAEYGWRMAFVAAGLPGIPLAIAYLFFLREPERGAQEAKKFDFSGNWRQRLADAFGFIRRDGRVMCIIVGAALLAAANTGVLGWFAPFLMREHDLDIKQAGLVIALGSGVCGGIGLIFTGTITDRLAKGDPGRMMFLCAVAAGITGLFSVWAVLAATVGMTIAAIMGYSLFCYAFLGISYAALLNLTPPHYRGTVIAIEMVMANLLGYGGGPYVVGVLSDLYGGEHSLRWAMLTLNLFYLAGVLCFFFGSAIDRRKVAAVAV
ncbi:spinster family MFS transporter [Sphingomonas montanisoli]|nr:MFS transporter [Sphingomonas montanisoli]